MKMEAHISHTTSDTQLKIPPNPLQHKAIPQNYSPLGLSDTLKVNMSTNSLHFSRDHPSACLDPSHHAFSSESRTTARFYVHDDYDEGDDTGTDNAHLLYAQKLNNNAAMCIEIGYYERAIQSLQGALKCSQKQSDESLRQVCRCRECRVDGCTDFSADFASETAGRACKPTISIGDTAGFDEDESSDDEFDYVRNRRNLSDKDISSMARSISHPKVQKVVRPDGHNSSSEGNNAPWSIKDEYCDEERKEHQDQEIYKRPIRVTREGHPMGSSLLLVITFNLALAHHLEVTTTYNHRSYDPKVAQKTLCFYQLTSTYEKKVLEDATNCWDSLSSVRLNTILKNNLHQLLYMVPDECVQATHRLVSTILNAIDNETDRLSRRKSKCCAGTENPKAKGVSKREEVHGRGSGLARSKKSATTRKSKLELALGGMSPTPVPGKKKLQVAVGDVTATMSRSSLSSRGSLNSRGR
eukprot:jgi/Psemu1/12926/gm1.12926_g